MAGFRESWDILGIAAAAKRGKWADRLITGYCIVIAGTPSFWLALVLLLAALIALEDWDRQLITALFYDHLSTREYARRIGVTQRAVIKRRDRILRDMKKHFEKFAA